MSLGGGDYHLKISTEGRVYEFDLQTTRGAANRYSIVTKDQGDVATIRILLERAFEQKPANLNELSNALRHIPSVTHVSSHPILKTDQIGLQTLQRVRRKKPEMSEKTALMDKRLQDYCAQRGFQGSVMVVEKGKVILQKGKGHLTKRVWNN